jgi:hypothetical protein
VRCRRRKKRLEEEDDMWVPPGSGRERDSGVGWVVRAAAGLLPGFGPQVRPSWVVLPFFCSEHFSFLFSILLHIFCKYYSNQAKPNSKFF